MEATYLLKIITKAINLVLGESFFGTFGQIDAVMLNGSSNKNYETLK
jgi:hypothetical protein